MSNRLYSVRHDPTIGRNRKSRPKTFKSADLAKEYAEKNKIENYNIEELSPYKFRISA